MQLDNEQDRAWFTYKWKAAVSRGIFYCGPDLYAYML